MTADEVGKLNLERWAPVRVRWVDSAAIPAWTSANEFAAAVLRGAPSILTVGQYWGVATDTLVVVLDYDEHNDNTHCATQIPLTAVLSVEPLLAAVAEPPKPEVKSEYPRIVCHSCGEDLGHTWEPNLRWYCRCGATIESFSQPPLLQWNPPPPVPVPDSSKG